MAFTEFYCDYSTGANINAGDLTANGVVTSTNGDWGNAAANRFTAAAGTPFSGVSVGDFASVYLDGATVAVYVARVTAVNAGGASIDLSATAKSGTAPTTGATGRSCTTGGAWKGPNGASGFPFGFVQNTMSNASTHPPRVNLKNNTQYDITAAMTHGNSGGTFQGYTTSVGDGGKATIDGGTSGASYVLLTASATLSVFKDLIFANNGASGTADGINSSGFNTFEGVVVHDVRGDGFNGLGGHFVGCEAYACGKGGAASGFNNVDFCSHCISHDNTGTGFNSNAAFNASVTFIKCIADTNTTDGFVLSARASVGTCVGCDAYNNGGDGFDLRSAAGNDAAFFLIDCNAIKNANYGIRRTDTGANNYVHLRNMGFGAGTEVNTSGATSFNANTVLDEEGTVNYPSNATPWNAPTTGDFSIALTEAKNAGWNGFTQTQGSYTGTVGYPDIGAAQHDDTGGGGGGSYVIGG